MTSEKMIVKGNFKAYIGGYDWGCGIYKIILSLDHEIDEVNQNSFIVNEIKQTTDFSTPDFNVIVQKFKRNILNVYLCDENGKETLKSSKYVTIEMAVSPNEGSPLLFSMHTFFNTYSIPYELEIARAPNVVLTSNGKEIETIEIEKQMESKVTDADAFELSHFKASDGIEYDYVSYTPATDSDTLVVWLHGIGEGGIENTDPYLTCLANKVTSLVGNKFQNIMGNAHVLVPQCPTFWMDKDGKGELNGGNILADGTSFYQTSLHELITEYKEKCQAKNVMIAGCSNGGYMTLLLALNYQDEYTAYVPICEAIADKDISDEQLQGIKDLPLYFIYSKDDTTVDPKKHEEPTIQRLRELNATNLHVSVFDSVIDTSGKYKDKEGNPYQYAGHWSWIYFFNNEADCNRCGKKVWQWLAEQKK